MSAPPKPRGRFPVSWSHLNAPRSSKPSAPLLRPQRPVQEAAQDAQRHAQVTGLGLDNPAMRLRMVHKLRADGIANASVLDAMALVPRHLFVDSALAAQAYEDTSLPIGHGQTISKPSVVARMLEWLMLGASARRTGHLGRVLEIGTGCGYQTALLCQLADRVVTVERLGALHRAALTRLSDVDGRRLHAIHGDGCLGIAADAPYDAIVAAAGGEDLPGAWLDQLAMGGRLVAPMRGPTGGQMLVIVDRTVDGLVRTQGERVQFVPLKSGAELD